MFAVREEPQYVTDSAKGCVELVTPLDGTVEFLTHLRDFFRNFGIHLLGQTGMDSTLVDAQTCLQGVTRLFKRCVSDVRLQIGSERITNRPEGTVANKTMQPCELMLRSTTRLLKASEFMSPEATHAIKLQSLLTLVVENIHVTTKMKTCKKLIVEGLRSSLGFLTRGPRLCSFSLDSSLFFNSF